MKTLKAGVLILAVPAVLSIAEVAQARTVTEDWYMEGPHSGADVKRVEEALRALPGVKFFEVSQATVMVRFDDQKLNDAALEAAVAHAGAFRLTRRVD